MTTDDRVPDRYQQPSWWYLTTTVTRHELARQWRNGAFWASVALSALTICAALALPALIVRDTDERPSVGLVGEQRALAAVLDPYADVSRYADLEQARSAVADGRVDAALIAPGEVVIARGLSPELARLLRWAPVVADASAANPAAATPPELRVTTVVPDPGRLQQRTLAAGAGVLLLALLLLLSGGAVAQNVAEEKSNRVVEVLLPKVRPWHLLAGKIVGSSAGTLAQVVLTTVMVLAVTVGLGLFDSPGVALGVAGNLLLWFLPAVVLFTTGYAVAGALVSRPEDVGHVTGSLAMAQLLCLAGPLLVVTRPEDVLTRVVSVLPGLSWAAMPVRVAYGDVPWWEVALAYALTWLTIAALIRLGSRAFSGALFHYGPSLPLIRALRRGPSTDEVEGGAAWTLRRSSG